VTSFKQPPPVGSGGGIAAYRRWRGSVYARRHCLFPGCGKVIPDRMRAGYCQDHRVAWERERRRLAERERRFNRALGEGRNPRPRSRLKWGWMYS
jgi:hypothetical protein